MFRLTMYLRDERGAVTADWLVLSAGIVVATMLALGAVQSATVQAAQSVDYPTPAAMLVRSAN